jgi:hypothetical protein
MMISLQALTRFTTASACALAFVTSASAIELANANRGFEAGDTSGWASFPTANSTFLSTGDSSVGSFAGVVNNPDSASNAVIKQANVGIGTVLPNQTLYISYDLKGDFGVGAQAVVEFFSELDGGGTSSASILNIVPTSSSLYTSYMHTVVTGPDVSGGVTLQFGAQTAAIQGSTAQIFVDNVSINTEIPEPTSAALIGLGSLGLLARRRRA